MEKSVEIGVKIVSLILFLMFLFPIYAGGWAIYDAIDVLMHSKSGNAKIVECDSRRSVRSRHKLAGYYGYSYVAETNDGVKVASTFRYKKRSQCRKNIGQDVSVYLYQSDLENSRINTFVQFWALPIGGGLISLFFLYVTYRGFRWFFKI